MDAMHIDPRTFKDFNMGDPIFPSDLEHSLETSDVKLQGPLCVFYMLSRPHYHRRMEMHTTWYTGRHEQ